MKNGTKSTSFIKYFILNLVMLMTLMTLTEQFENSYLLQAIKAKNDTNIFKRVISHKKP